VAKTAEVYLEIYFQQGGKKVKQQKVAQNLGKSRKTISRHIDKIEKFLREKMKKN
jgi:biotin operon repressor